MNQHYLETAAAILVALVIIVAPSNARAEFYAGGSVGRVAVDATVESVRIDGRDTANKLILGYIFDLPVVDLSLETNYVDFGSPRYNPLGAKFEIRGLDAFVVAGLDFGFVGAFAKAGVIAWNADFSSESFNSSTDGNDAAYGIGLRFNVASLFIRAEYEKFNIKSAEDVDMFSAGLVWRF